MKGLAAIVLAAGKGKRMKSALPKVLHPVAGKPMLHYPIEVLRSLGAKRVAVVTGHGGGEVRSALIGKDGKGGRGMKFCLQSQQLGTGHAVKCGMKGLKGFKGDVLILSGDVPLITASTIKALLKLHRRARGRERPVLSFVSAILVDPTGYGRVIRDGKGRVTGIVEQKELKGAERDIHEVNAGIYVVSSEFLIKNLKRLKKKNAQGEYYLTDLVSLASEGGGRKNGKKVSALTHLDPEEVMGVNTRVELARAGAAMRGRIVTELMLSGVTVMDPDSAYVDSGVRVGRDTTLYPDVHLVGETAVGAGSTIEEGVKIKDSVIGPGTTVKSFSMIESSLIGKNATIGPFARLRPGNSIGDGARIGNFVEVKNSKIGKGTKANHLSYIGDAVIGKDVNIGAGTITCNYDGAGKHRTTIEDGAFIGSDTQLVAPVRVGKGAYIGSGSTITKNVPAGSLALSRAEQKIVKGWVKKRKKG
ncbi:MAG: bifunctional UDP-N-acetylglucosamine diphosphorylase/glucosamine-1-phosphate N-acetyltransferase GlmU [Thermodesulfobacteriota bacterium]